MSETNLSNHIRKQKLLTYPGESKRITSLPNHIHKHALLVSTNGEREIHVRSLVTSQNGELSTKSGNEPERRVTNMQSKNQPCILERRINEEENKPENPR